MPDPTPAKPADCPYPNDCCRERDESSYVCDGCQVVELKELAAVRDARIAELEARLAKAKRESADLHQMIAEEDWRDA